MPEYTRWTYELAAPGTPHFDIGPLGDDGRVDPKLGLIATELGYHPEAVLEAEVLARRVTAIWNATRDIPTEALEAVAQYETAEGRLNALARVPGGGSRTERSRM